MRYGLISDIHGNLEAFQAVLDALSKERIDEYLSIGDVVGYGADPGACMRLIKSIKPQALIAGNHDWGVVGLTDIGYFNDMARAAVIWTRGVLGRDELDYLKTFRLVYERGDIILVHGTLVQPENFSYMLSAYDAYSTMEAMKACLCFVGHSHVPGIFYLQDDRAMPARPSRFKIDRRKKYVVNVGSIGQPRDYDPRASYCVYDDEECTVEIKRIEYDIKRAQGKILKAGLPQELAFRLSRGM